jgi:hypothetical protein
VRDGRAPSISACVTAALEERAPNVHFSELVEPTPVDSVNPGRWYEIRHYQRRYVDGARHNGQRARCVLEGLLGMAIDPSIRNGRGQTVLDVARRQAATRPLLRCKSVQGRLDELAR